MLATGVISIGIKFRIAIPIQRLCTSIKTYSTSGSSSDSSSDSDSDSENIRKIKQKEQFNKIPSKYIKPTRIVNTLADNVTKKSNDIKVTNVAIPSRETTQKKKLFTKKNVPYEAQITKAAEDVANVLGGGKEEIKWKLLNRLIHVNPANKKTGKYSDKQLRQLLTTMKANKKSGFSINNVSKHSTQPTNSISSQLIMEKKKQALKSNEKFVTTATTTTTTNVDNVKNQIEDRQRKSHKNVEFALTNGTIFTNMKKNTTVSELSTWQSLQQRELDLLSTQSPKNFFQEMIQWTESGKLWKFPIDNEYGMEEESNVHFSEHVFLEHHLKDWCPRRGPIRHYMELVCTGLSKNPYMTVDEKIGHITWYKEYFSGKKELLIELGAIDATSSNEGEIKT